MKLVRTLTLAILLPATQIGTPAAAYFRVDQFLEIGNIVPENNWAVLRRYVLVFPIHPTG